MLEEDSDPCTLEE
jgi:hypothetical protein